MIYCSGMRSQTLSILRLRRGAVCQPWTQAQTCTSSSSAGTITFPPEHSSRDSEEATSTSAPSEAAQRLVGRMLRANLTAEAASARLFAGQSALRPQAGDIKLFQDKGQALLERVKLVAPQHRTRPSLVAPVARAAAFGLGAASAYLPNSIRATIGGAMQEAIVEQYNDQLRDLREAGFAEELRDVRITLRELRDEERAPEGTKAPDLMKLQRPQDLSLEEGVAGVVKYGFKALFSASERV